MFFCFRIGAILLNMTFSNTFERTGNKLIGLYELTVLSFLFGFGIALIWLAFQVIGKYCNRRIPLNNFLI